jgi:hypothetical protein
MNVFAADDLEAADLLALARLDDDGASRQQVLDHGESTRLQYGLADRGRSRWAGPPPG